MLPPQRNAKRLAECAQAAPARRSTLSTGACVNDILRYRAAPKVSRECGNDATNVSSSPYSRKVHWLRETRRTQDYADSNVVRRDERMARWTDDPVLVLQFNLQPDQLLFSRRNRQIDSPYAVVSQGYLNNSDQVFVDFARALAALQWQNPQGALVVRSKCESFVKTYLRPLLFDQVLRIREFHRSEGRTAHAVFEPFQVKFECSNIYLLGLCTR